MGGWGEDKGPTPLEVWKQKDLELATILTEKVQKHKENPSTNNQRAMYKAADNCVDHTLKRPK
jgi:uncharacterized protein YgiB involved in biofilm formation